MKPLLTGGLGALGFGFLQREVRLPGITGVPNSLTYGSAALAVGLVAKSRFIIDAATGPFYAGLHNVGLRGVTKSEADEVGGEFDDVTAGSIGSGGDSVGEFEDVAAGDFDDL